MLFAVDPKEGGIKSICSNNKIYSKSHLCRTRHPWRSRPFQLLFPPVVRSASELVHKPLVRNNLEDFVLVVVPGMEEQEIKSSTFTSYQNQILFYQFLESCTLDWNSQQNLSFQCFLLYIYRGKFFLLHFNVCECCLSCAIGPIAAWEKSCCAHTTGLRSKVISMINIDGISNTNFKELCWLIVWCPKEICKHCWQNILSGYVQTPMTDPMRQHA